jgi:hypothetical protein
MITEQPKPKKVRISYRFNPEKYYFVRSNGRVKRGNYCRSCGAPLKDPVSIKRGYGRNCWNEVPVIIVLDIPPSETSNE